LIKESNKRRVWGLKRERYKEKTKEREIERKREKIDKKERKRERKEGDTGRKKDNSPLSALRERRFHLSKGQGENRKKK